MKNKVLELYLNTNKKPCKIAKQLGITLDEFYNYLLEFNYPARNNGRTWTFKAKKAVDFYIENPETSLNDLERMFGIDACSIKKALVSCNVDIVNKYFIKRFNEHVFDSIDTEEKAYWLGFIFADGCIASKERSHFRPILSFTLCLEDFNHLLKFDNFINGDNRPKKYWYTDYKGLKKQHSVSSYCSQHLWNSLYNLGCFPRKSLILKYPKIHSHLKRHFARGYFDGDGSFGCYGKYKYINLSCVGTYDILSNLYSDLDVEYSLYNHKGHKKETLTLSCSTKKAKKILDYMYKDAKIYLDRKYEKYLELCRE